MPKSVFDSPGDSPGFLLWHVTLRWQRLIRAALAPHELTHVQFVLLASAWWLGEYEEMPTQQRLAARAGTDTMMTSQVLRKLEDRGLVSREADPADARARLLGITQAGRALLTGAMADVERADAEFFAALDEDQHAFASALARLT
jgi:DNA-binding MarR family transcriptional regulator